MPILLRVPWGGGKRPLNPSKLSPNLAENSWKMIAQASEEGIASSLWKVGDEIDIVLSGDYKGSITMQVAGFDHDNLAAGGKAGITFISKQLLESANIYTNYYYFDGWEKSTVRTDTMPRLKTSLPDVLQGLLKPVVKLSSWDSPTAVQMTVDDMFIPSVYEIFPQGSAQIPSEFTKISDGTRYSLFEDADNIVKNMQGSGVSPWWSRSCYSRFFGYIESDGTVKTGSPHTKFGICFGFCV